jgi:RNA polymerase sigma factor (sigma-70 family)
MTRTGQPTDVGRFAATRWTLVLAAARGDRTLHGSDALAELCRLYWYPLYAFVRRSGHDRQQSEDLIQEFFARLLAGNALGGVDRAKGKFRSFLLAALKHFLTNAWDRSRAQKRGGGQIPISLDGLSADTRYRLEPADDRTPDKVFERQWALTVLEQALARLKAEHVGAGKGELFDDLKGFLTGDGQTGSYRAIAVRRGVSEGALKVAVHRVRKRYRALLRDEVAQTVTDPNEIDGEIRALFAAFR